MWMWAALPFSRAFNFDPSSRSGITIAGSGRNCKGEAANPGYYKEQGSLESLGHGINADVKCHLALSGGDVDLRPVLQVMDVRQIGNAQTTQERYRLVLSDGLHLQQAMLATQLNEHVKSGKVMKGSIVQLLEYICNTVQNRKIIIILNMEVVASQAEIVGDPKPLIAGAEQQAAGPGPGPGSVQHQQQPPAVSAQPQPQQAFGTNVQNGRLGGLGQPMNGSYTEGRGAGNSVPQPSAGAYNAYSSAGSGNKIIEPGGFQRSSTLGGYQAGNGGLNHQVQPQNPYGKPIVASPYQPAPMYSNRGPIAKNEAPARIVPIAALNPYQGRWTIKARVTAKSDIRRFHNAKGDGKVCSFDLLDGDGGEIRVTCFNTVVDQFFDRIEVGRVYLVTKGSLKAAQKKFNHLKNEWEIFLESSSTVEPCMEEDGSIPQQHYDFKPISDIENMENDAILDIVGIVVATNPSNTIMRKNGLETQKRTLQLRDRSGRSVEITMWGAFCGKEGQVLQDLCDSGQYPVLVVKAGRVSDFSGRSVGTISSTQLLINPDIPAAHQVRDWFDREGKNSESQSISREGGAGGRVEVRKTVSAIKDEGLGRNDKPDWIAVRATVFFVKTESFCYTACPLLLGDKQCNKKVTNNGDGTWRCDRCDRSVPECDYRYLLNLQVQDHTGLTWITAFQEAGKDIIGYPAKELYMWNQDQSLKFDETIQRLLFTQHIFKLKVKEEMYNDEQRIKSTVVKSDAIDWVAESKLMIDWIGKLARGEAAHGPSVATISGSGVGGTYASATPGFGGPSYGVTTTAGTGPSLGGGGGYGGVGGGGYAEAFNGNGNTYGGGGGGVGGGTSGQCFKCGKEGHFARDCTNDAGGARGGASYGGAGGFGGGGSGSSSTNNCFKCGQGGHFARDCPNQGGSGGAGYGGRSSGGGGYGGTGGFGGGGGFGGRSGGYGGGY